MTPSQLLLPLPLPWDLLPSKGALGTLINTATELHKCWGFTDAAPWDLCCSHTPCHNRARNTSPGYFALPG